jgi:hypothetical protein
MLIEVTVIILVALGAIGLVVLGIVELLWPSRPWRSGPSGAEPAARRWRSHHPRHAANGPARYLKRPTTGEEVGEPRP